MQLDSGRHFLIENPWSSAIWRLSFFVLLLSDPRVKCAHCDQCMYGLVDAANVPTRKSTAFVSSSETLIWRLRNQCNGKHQHAQLAGSLNGIPKCKFSQVWPYAVCQAIVLGICELKNKTSRLYNYPAAASTCKACSGHLARDDTRHTRVEGVCRFPFDLATVFTCPGCTAFKHSLHSSHTKVLGDCRYAAAQTRRVGFRTSADPYVPPQLQKLHLMMLFLAPRPCLQLGRGHLF